MNIKHFVLYESTQSYSNGCSCCEPIDFTYYDFEDEQISNSIGTIDYVQEIPMELYEYLGYHIPDYLDEYDERVEYAEKMLGILGITWEVKQEA